MATFVIGRLAGDLSAGLPRPIRLGQFLVAAGVNAKALSTYIGHASIKTTLDRYGHLMPGNEAEAAALLDTYSSGRPPFAEKRRAVGKCLG